jgi:hypothetical protein
MLKQIRYLSLFAVAIHFNSVVVWMFIDYRFDVFHIPRGNQSRLPGRHMTKIGFFYRIVLHDTIEALHRGVHALLFVVFSALLSVVDCFLSLLSMSSARTRASSSGQAQQRASTTSSAVSRRSKSPDILQSEQPGLRRIVQQRLLKDVFDSTSGT